MTRINSTNTDKDRHRDRHKHKERCRETKNRETKWDRKWHREQQEQRSWGGGGGGGTERDRGTYRDEQRDWDRKKERKRKSKMHRQTRKQTHQDCQWTKIPTEKERYWWTEKDQEAEERYRATDRENVYACTLNCKGWVVSDLASTCTDTESSARQFCESVSCVHTNMTWHWQLKAMCTTTWHDTDSSKLCVQQHDMMMTAQPGSFVSLRPVYTPTWHDTDSSMLCAHHDMTLTAQSCVHNNMT